MSKNKHKEPNPFKKTSNGSYEQEKSNRSNQEHRPPKNKR